MVEEEARDLVAVLGVPVVFAAAPRQPVEGEGLVEVVEAPGDYDIVVEVGVEGDRDDGVADAGEQGANLFPACDGAALVVLAEGQLHEEQGQAEHNHHDCVRDEECAATVFEAQIWTGECENK